MKKRIKASLITNDGYPVFVTHEDEIMTVWELWVDDQTYQLSLSPREVSKKESR